MRCPNGAGDPHPFALVTYIPGRLGTFLDDLRRKLVPGCKPHAHITILPPRPICADSRTASEEIRQMAADFQPFDVRLGSVEIFEPSEVIYLGVIEGHEELRRMYTGLNRGSVAYREQYAYHPHVTLVQNLEGEQVRTLFKEATRMWAEYSGPKTFHVDALDFVENVLEDCWIDLANIPLQLAQPVG